MTHRTRTTLQLVLGLLLFTAVFTGCGKSTAPAESALRAPWQHANSDLTPDTRITFGELDNGFRYILCPNPKPADRVYIRLVVETGSMNESDAQQGLAHFLEHMAFNGSKNYKPDQIVDHFQRLGMAFGRDINAHTTFDETTYYIDLPNSKPEMMAEGMTLMRDYAGELLVLETEIEKERGVILSEMRDSNTPEYRDHQAAFNFIAPNTPVSQRWPIGNKEAVAAMKRPLFVKYIKDFYTANRMTLVVTGDIKPDELKAEIAKRFGDLTNGPATDAEIVYTPGPARLTATNVDTELSKASVSLMWLTPYDARPDSLAVQTNIFRQRCALAMLNQRLAQAALDDDKILALDASYYSFFEYCDMGDLSGEGEAADIPHIIQTLDQSIRQAITYGFNDQNIAAAKATMLQRLEKIVEADPTRKSKQLSDQYAQAVTSKYVLVSAADDLAMAKTALADFTNDDVKALLKSLFTTGEFRLFVSSNKPVENAETALLAAFDASTKVAVKDPRAQGATAFAYTKFGTAGKVVATAPADAASAKLAKELDISMLKFENNTRLNVKTTDFEKGRIGVTVRFGDGLLSLPVGKPGLQLFTRMVYDVGGLAKHKVMELRQLLAGKSVSSGFSTGEDCFTLSGSTDAKNLLTQMQLMCAYLTDPGFHDEAVKKLQMAVPMIYAQMATRPEGALQTQLMPLIRNDYRFAFPTQKDVLARTVAEARAWLNHAQSKGYLEISVVGDVDKQAVIDAVASTFGALPTRQAAKTIHPAQKSVKTNTTLAKLTRGFTYNGSQPKSLALVMWPLGEGDDVHQTRLQSMLSRIFSDRIRKKVREELGLAYSPYVMCSPSSVFPSAGFYLGYVGTSPETADQVTAIVQQIGQDLADKGVTDDEFKQVQLPALESIKTRRKTNEYWLESVLPGCASETWRLAASADMVDYYTNMTKEMLLPVAKKYLQSGSAFRCWILPANYKPAAEPAEKKAA